MSGTMELTRLAEDLLNERSSIPQASSISRASIEQHNPAGPGPSIASYVDESSTTQSRSGQGDGGSTGSGNAVIVGLKCISVQTIF
jgi:hypothetical protein